LILVEFLDLSYESLNGALLDSSKNGDLSILFDGLNALDPGSELSYPKSAGFNLELDWLAWCLVAEIDLFNSFLLALFGDFLLN